jgi:hypothetical protein
MSYKLYTDKTEMFECDVSVKNASLKNSTARLIIESEDLTLVFKGTINDGKCSIPIRKLKGLLSENSTGTMALEVIVEDTFFKPWESDFIVEEHTSVKVMVNEQKKDLGKPVIAVKVSKKAENTVNLAIPISEISSICNRFGITKNNVKSKKQDFSLILKEYFNTIWNIRIIKR